MLREKENNGGNIMVDTKTEVAQIKLSNIKDMFKIDGSNREGISRVISSKTEMDVE